MPTIDQLENAVVASDDDMLPVSQNGIARRVSRSQLLAGTQAVLSLETGLLGRASPGLGPPQQITLGDGLSLSAGVLSAASKYSASALPLSATTSLSDLVAISRDGQDQTVSVKTLLSIPGLDVSEQVVKAGVGSARSLGQWLGDVVAVEAFGAIGDGSTDDTASFNLAVASGRPVLLGPRTYRIDGQWDVQVSATLIGTAGMTVLRRVSQRGGAWINVTGPKFTSVGVGFDAGALDGDSWGVLIAPECTETFFSSCVFFNSTGKTLGNGLTIQARDGLAGVESSHSLLSCTFRNNDCHGLWIQAASGAVVADCQASENRGYGICLDFNDPRFEQTVRQSIVTSSRCWNNMRGISVGNYNATNSEPPQWGLGNPDALDITVSNNVCVGNSEYGIAVSGARIQVTCNQVLVQDPSATASGILCNASLSTIAGNSIVGSGQFGIDSGGSADLSIAGNLITGFSVGMNAGGSIRVCVRDNKLMHNARSITVFQVDTDGNGTNFGLTCSDLWIEDNLIQLDADAGGIFLLDGPQRVEVARNRFISPALGSAKEYCAFHTDSVFFRQNTLDGALDAAVSSRFVGSSVAAVFPDFLDRGILPGSIGKVDAISGLHQMAMVGQISFIRVINGGQGYTQARVVIAGDGAGAAAVAYLHGGVVIGIALNSGGSGYDPAATTAVIEGDGSGATLRPSIGVPPPQGRRLTLLCSSSVHFTQGNAGGVQTNWTGTEITAAAGSEVVLLASNNGWQAISFTNIDYLQPGGDGSVALRSVSGDIRLRTGAGGGVRVQSDIEQSGFLTYFGRGSPEGEVAAPPGSDYRNLEGGVGATLWLKRVGTDNSGWFPVA